MNGYITVGNRALSMQGALNTMILSACAREMVMGERAMLYFGICL